MRLMCHPPFTPASFRSTTRFHKREEGRGSRPSVGTASFPSLGRSRLRSGKSTRKVIFGVAYAVGCDLVEEHGAGSFTRATDTKGSSDKDDEKVFLRSC